jgi:2-oxoglutarate ferredoxin oxidoreductase subunit beta
MNQSFYPPRRHIREGALPHFFCPGCGCGQILNFFLRAIDELGLDLDTMVAIGGVGCTARIPVYLKTDGLHGIHGRTIPWAMGIKLIRPKLKVVIFAGDGDAASIGGNHLIHAARRNLDVTFIVVNNFNYGMTGGQVAPTTPSQLITMTTPYGNSEPPFDLCRLAQAAGATYVSRWTTARPIPTINSLKRALQHKGFSFVEILSPCPTHFGRYALGSGNAEVLIKWMESKSVTLSKAKKFSEEELAGRFVLGEFINIERPIFMGSTVYRAEDCQ